MTPSDEITPTPIRIRRCVECGLRVTSHSEQCAVGRSQRAELERIRRAAELKVLTMYAARRAVRAFSVRAAEKTMRGPAVVEFAMTDSTSGRAPRR